MRDVWRWVQVIGALLMVAGWLGMVITMRELGWLAI